MSVAAAEGSYDNFGPPLLTYGTVCTILAVFYPDMVSVFSVSLLGIGALSYWGSDDEFIRIVSLVLGLAGIFFSGVFVVQLLTVGP